MTDAKLQRQRGWIKSALTRHKNHIDAINEDQLTSAIIEDIQSRLEKIGPLFEKFDLVQYEIESKLDEVTQEEENERSDFENAYFSCMGKGNSFIKLFQSMQDNVSQISNPLPANNNDNRQSSIQVKFPPIKLPMFSGIFDKWLEFRDAFSALVDKNQFLSDVEKFYYLRSSLQGQASEVIESMEVTSSNYKIAWDLISERFENKRLIVFNHIKAIFDFPPIHKEGFDDLRKLYDNFTRHLRSLRSLEQPTDSWDTILIYLITSKLDSVTRREWESYDINNDMPTMTDMNIFLKKRCDLLEKLQYNLKLKDTKHDNKQYFKKPFNDKQFSSHVSVNKLKCYFCNEAHLIYVCEKLLAFPPRQRLTELKKLNLCINCFRPGHSSDNCTYSKCKKCNRKHNTLVHIDSTNKNAREVQNHNYSSSSSERPSKILEEPQTITANTIKNSYSSQVLLATAIILIEDKQGKFHKAKALLDNGSMSSFISDQFASKLNLPRSKVSYCVKGVGEALANINNRTTVSFKSIKGNFSRDVSCLIIPKITEPLPNYSFSIKDFKVPPNIQLADPDFNKRSKIDVLMGADIFWELVLPEQIHIGDDKPFLHKTRLGWVVSGSLSNFIGSNSSASCLHSVQLESQVSEQLLKFWQLEECDSSRKVLSGSDRFCEEHFQNNFKRSESGRFIVKIPLKETVSQLGNSEEIARKRFFALEKRLNKNAQLKSQYVAFMREYQELGHMSPISSDTFSSNKGSVINKTFYLPHHMVRNESHLTTKTRTVFDASAKSDTGLSLNDVQYSGPTIQSDLFAILLRFRQYPFVLSADISKMYRQILVDDTHKPLQRIFWRENSENPLQCFQLNTVTYGFSAAPWLAVRCLYQLSIDNEARFPKAAKVIRSDFYVDDLLTGSNTIQELLEVQKNVSMILSSAGFDLRKWLTNRPEHFDKFEVKEGLNLGILQLGENENNKTLGILWNSNSDIMQYSIRSVTNMANNISKRFILSTVSQIYDPLGLLGPIIVRFKLILQELWRAGVDWDTPVPQDILNNWCEIYSDLQDLNQVKIPRFILGASIDYIELHGFCDASERAYGACVYIRSRNSIGNFTCHLLCAKSRVAPLKQISLPRLELCGASLLSHLVTKVNNSMSISISKQFLWSDSTVTLGWIRGEARNWKTFVANRVGDIQNLTDPSTWHHVNSSDNPADLLSRGNSVGNILNSSLWWHGPEWLMSDVQFSSEIPVIDNMPDRRTTVAHVTISEGFDIFQRFSSIIKLQRVTAYLIRFINNSKVPKTERSCGQLSVLECKHSLNALIRMAQRETFPLDYNNLLNNKTLNTKSSLLCLNPFLDNNKIVRVGGRLCYSDYNFDKKHPIILPSKHKLTELILTQEHIRLFHCGPQQLLASIRERFWPIAGRNIARKTIRNCVTCFKMKPVPEQYLMGNIPRNRISQFTPFVNVGIDYAGPILIKDRKLRGARLIKSYVCLFVCMSIKAVHLDLVTELTTDSFLQVLKRFVARRGRPCNIYSDNGTQFVGANSKLKEWFSFLETSSEPINNFLLKDNISWHFIPARSPNFGGLWEAGIKSMKYHLKRVVGNLQLTFEDMLTVLTQIEGILNSRPLTPLSSDPCDTTPLTPAHFIIGKSLTSIPEQDFCLIPESRLKKFQLMQQAIQHFWKRWHKEYISEIQTRIKWKSNYPSLLKVDSLVLIKDDDQPHLKWKLGRVSKLHPGKDNVVRVASVRLSNGNEVQRAVSKLCVLPVEKDS